MDEWWTYTLSDLLLFSPRTYYRLLERQNEALWPWQLITLAMALGIFGLLQRPVRWQGRAISGFLSIAWASVAWSFFWTRYATINWAAKYFALLFALELLLIVWVGVVQGRLRFRLGGDVPGRFGVAILGLAVVIYPVLAPLAGRPWQQAEIFGVAPDPTVLATLGLLLLRDGPPRWELLPGPILWCSISGATLWAMESPEALIPPLSALVVIVVSARWQIQRNPAHADPGEQGARGSWT